VAFLDLGFEIRSLTHNRYRTFHPELAGDVENRNDRRQKDAAFVDAAKQATLGEFSETSS
jgi:hypothetical protein